MTRVFALLGAVLLGGCSPALMAISIDNQTPYEAVVRFNGGGTQGSWYIGEGAFANIPHDRIGVSGFPPYGEMTWFASTEASEYDDLDCEASYCTLDNGTITVVEGELALVQIQPGAF